MYDIADGCQGTQSALRDGTLCPFRPASGCARCIIQYEICVCRMVADHLNCLLRGPVSWLGRTAPCLYMYVTTVPVEEAVRPPRFFLDLRRRVGELG